MSNAPRRSFNSRQQARDERPEIGKPVRLAVQHKDREAGVLGSAEKDRLRSTVTNTSNLPLASANGSRSLIIVQPI